MKKLDFWRADWILGAVVALSGPNLIRRLERRTYDHGIGQLWADAVTAAAPATSV